MKFPRCSRFAAFLAFTMVGGVALVGAADSASLQVRAAGEKSVRITVRPAGMTAEFVATPVLALREVAPPVLDVTPADMSESVSVEMGELRVTVAPSPLTVTVRNAAGRMIQQLTFADDGTLGFRLDEHPVFGLGEGGPNFPKEIDWREQPVEFDRRGRLHEMWPQWQRQAYGSRNPVALMWGTAGWGLYIPMPWGRVDLSDPHTGRFLPLDPKTTDLTRQDFKTQWQRYGKGVPPAASLVPGYFDVFVFDATDPLAAMRDVAAISGEASLPPKWALGYMQSHRTLADDGQMVQIVDTFREKKIPIDAVIYLGTGFTPRGWNTRQPSFDFNPEVFRRDPSEVLADLHQRHVKVVLHMVPWDRDRLPLLRGDIPAAESDTGPGHIAAYWREHESLVAAGVDGWWPDEGDWLDLFERMKRHQLYYEGPISTQPDRRPWSLHRNGHLGVARWGGWIWSGDTDSSWKALEAQIANGLNHALSVGPFWGTDIGGFFPSPELDGELYARWFQFGAFCPSFRAHGQTWRTRLPWGWGLADRGPLESPTPPLPESMNNHAIEPIARSYAELRYQLLPYNYTLAWEARAHGLPPMRALWLHHPGDPIASATADEYLWGRDLLVAPVYEKGATTRAVYLPAGKWYDWWTLATHEGGQTIARPVDLATMPLFVRAGAIIPVDPIRQYTAQPVDEPTTLRIFPGADGRFTFYDDDGTSLAYLQGELTIIDLSWDDSAQTLTLVPQRNIAPREFLVGLATAETKHRVTISEQPLTISLAPAR